VSVQTPVFGAYHTTKADPVFLIEAAHKALSAI
jgi:hypothetical protein